MIEEVELNDVYSPPENLSVEVDHQKSIFEKLILHRGNIFKELVEAVRHREINFQSVQIEMILPNGKSEQAEDIGGVLRDCISEFFRDFYETCTMGANYKVPALRHDFQNEEWSAIGKIIRESFLSESYFPIKLAPAFVKNCLGQEVEDDEVLQNFIKYVSSSDATLLKNALNDFEKVDMEELKEFCSNYDAKWIPSKNNFGTLIIQIAREELIQKPAFVKECISPHLLVLKDQLHLEVLYSKYDTTDKNIIALLDIDEKITTEQKQIFNYLKRYIKESDQKIKSAFLRFCTGSDLPIQRIKIEFTNLEGFGRIPVAHTCAGLLQIPSSYENFMIFRSELNNLFSSDIWIMDIV